MFYYSRNYSVLPLIYRLKQKNAKGKQQSISALKIFWWLCAIYIKNKMLKTKDIEEVWI